MDKRQVREWREAYLAHNRQVIEEARRRTVLERWSDTNDLYASVAALGLEWGPDAVLEVRERWHRLREAYGRTR